MPTKDLIQHRRGPTTQWAASTELPQEGQFVYDTTTGALKIGDGESSFDELPIIGKQFQNVVTVAKDGKKGSANFICSDSQWGGDNTLCIQAALNSLAVKGGGTLEFMDGNFICASQLVYTGSNLHVRGQGYLTVLDFSTFPTETLTFIVVAGEATATNSVLSENATKNSLTITVEDGTKFSVNDWIRIRSEAIFSSDATASWVQTIGEIQQIASITGNVLTLKERLHEDYKTTDTAKADLLTMKENITFRDFKIVGPAGVDHIGIHINYAYNVTVDHVSCDDIYERAIYIQNVVGATVENNLVRRSNMDGLGYGVAISDACRDSSVSKNHFFNCRHGITATGIHHYGIQYNITYSDNTMSHDSKSMGLFGMHPLYDGMTITGNSTTGCSLGFFNGKNTTVTGNHVQSYGAAGVFLPECSENTIVADNTIEVSGHHGIYSLSEKVGNKICNNKITCDTADYDGILIAHQTERTQIENNNIISAGKGINITTNAEIKNSKDIKISDNWITATEQGIYIHASASSISDLKISKNVVDSDLVGIETICTNFAISKLSIEDNTVTVPDVVYCISLSSSGTALHTYPNILRNICYGAATSIYLEDCTAPHVFDNIFHDGGTFGIGVGTVTNRLVQRNSGYNPIGYFTSPATPTSGADYTNNFGYPCFVSIYGGTVSSIQVDGIFVGFTTGTLILLPGDAIKITYTAAPTWKWWGL